MAYLQIHWQLTLLIKSTINYQMATITCFSTKSSLSLTERKSVHFWHATDVFNPVARLNEVVGNTTVNALDVYFYGDLGQGQ